MTATKQTLQGNSIGGIGATNDMVRLSHSKRDLDVASNTIRAWAKEYGLPIYKMGKAAFVSRADFAAVIRARGLQQKATA